VGRGAGAGTAVGDGPADPVAEAVGATVTAPDLPGLLAGCGVTTSGTGGLRIGPVVSDSRTPLSSTVAANSTRLLIAIRRQIREGCNVP
jgi:hypothetical protein